MTAVLARRETAASVALTRELRLLRETTLGITRWHLCILREKKKLTPRADLHRGKMLLSVKNYLKGPYTLADGPEIREPVPHKWLPGETIDLTTRTVVSKIPHRHIIGIVDFMNRTGMGFTPRGVPLYLCHPLDPKYPPMIVSSKLHPIANQIVSVSIEHWEEKWPRAGIQRILGNVGDSAVEKEALLLRASIPLPVDNTEWIANVRYHEEISWDAVFNIDPDGCEDVDDVICWRKKENGYEMAIAIADVASWVAEDSAVDKYAEKAGQTLYNNGKVVAPMLPTSLSTRFASLRDDGIARPALAYCFTVECGEVVSHTWRRLLIRVGRSYTYESVLSDDAVSLILPRLLRALTGLDVGEDPHYWIEVAMIAYNRAAAALLREADVGILRAHEGRSNSEYSALAESSGCRELAFLGSSAGKYVKGDAVVCAHAGLGLDVYCHASSPLRRYADLVAQRWLHHLVFGVAKPVTCSSPTHLNERGAVSKAYERDMWFLEHLQMLTVSTVQGIVLKDTDEKVVVYVPEWRRKIRGVRAEGVTELALGAKVTVRAFTDLRRCTWSDRVVCSVEYHP